jgi:hypothetical protein
MVASGLVANAADNSETLMLKSVDQLEEIARYLTLF